MTSLRRSHLLCLALSLAACGGSAPPDDAGIVIDGGPGDAGSSADAFVPDASADDAGPIDPPIDAAPAPDAAPSDAGMPLLRVGEGLCAPLARAICRAPWECGCPGAGPRPDEAACIAAQTEGCVRSLEADVGPDLLAGRAMIDEAALDACGARIAHGFDACSAVSRDLNAWCVGVIVDSAAIGDACSEGGRLCAGGEGACLDRCVALPVVGAACDAFPLCATGATCREGTCVALAPAGGTCALDSECEAGLSCSGGVCRAMLVAIGGSCTSTAECVVSARCSEGSCVAGAGRACVTDDSCSSLERCASDFGQRCVPYADTGAACDSNECAPGAYCAFGTSAGVCTLEPGLGEPCAGGCAVGASCDFDTGVCVPLGNVGQPCAGGDEDGCHEGLSCVDDVCGAAPDFGQPCARNGECAGDLRCRFDATVGTERCGPPAEPGEPCVGISTGGRSECIDGYACSFPTGVCQPLRIEGETCGGRDCSPGLDCIPDPSTGAETCRPIPGIGEVCSSRCVEGVACAYGPLPGTCVPRVCGELPDDVSGRPD